jgi:hypothetical protein
MEQFFSRISSPEDRDWLKPILNLIAELRTRGYDRQFRAGQSLHIFRVSRSLMHGLSDDQPWLHFELRSEGGMELWYCEPPHPDTIINVDRVEITPEVEDFIARLLAHPID